MNKHFLAHLEQIESSIKNFLPLEANSEWKKLSFGNENIDSKHIFPLIETTRSLVDLGGKRWRPLLLVLCARACAKDKEKSQKAAYLLAPLVEFVHTASLIHDDIEDSSPVRRGKPAAYITYGIDTAINAGSWLYFEAPLCIEKLNCSIELKNRLFSNYLMELRRLHLGQAMDIAWHRDNTKVPSVQEYLEMVKGKTGTLASLAAKTGALASNADDETVKKALLRAITDKKRGYGELNLEVKDEALNHIAAMSGGDLRTAYNALELAVLTTEADKSGKITVTLKDAEQSIQRKALSYDENSYYDMLSAFCKSLRGSDSDAALYYAHRIISGGGDPLLIFRRLLAHSAEDVGMADPRALVVCSSALTAFQNMGYPEGLLPLSEAIIYVCEAPKSNSVVVAMNAAQAAAQSTKDDTVPMHIRNAVFGDKEAKAKSREYKYPHDYGGYVEQQYLPDSLKGSVFYTPGNNGFETEVKKLREKRGK
ncbi:MAG TPA: hypothetical protein DCW73_04300 [Treponema sp.]|nr:hypothetical protein [Treponema sp.]